MVQETIKAHSRSNLWQPVQTCVIMMIIQVMW